MCVCLGVLYGFHSDEMASCCAQRVFLVSMYSFDIYLLSVVYVFPNFTMLPTMCPLESSGGGSGSGGVCVGMRTVGVLCSFPPPPFD